MPFKWIKDLKAEHGMHTLGIKWEIQQDVPVVDIDMEMSQEHQARIDKKVDESRIIQIAEAIANGVVLPMPILQRMVHKKRWHIWSGNHRTAGADLFGLKAIDAYVVSITDLRMQDLFPRVVNAWEGVRESQEAEAAQAAYMCEKHGYSVDEMAKAFNLKTNYLSTCIRANGVASELRLAGIREDLPKSTLILLSPIDNRNVRNSVVRTLLTHKVPPSSEKAKHLISDVKAGKTELQQMGEIARWERMFEGQAAVATSARTTPKLHLGNRTRLTNLLFSTKRFLDNIRTATQLQLDEESTKLVATTWIAIREKMEKLMTEDVG